MSLRFHPGVQCDINEVLDYYSERSLTAADRFWDELHECFRDIAENPKHFSFINATRGLRRILLRKFPYLVIFYESANGGESHLREAREAASFVWNEAPLN